MAVIGRAIEGADMALSVARLALATAGRRGEPRLPRPGESVGQAGLRVDASRAAAYERVISRSGPSASFLATASAVVPLYASIWEFPLCLRLLAEAGAVLPGFGLLHTADEVVQVRPLRIGERFRCEARINAAEGDESGVRIELLTRNWTAAGQLCTERTITLLARPSESGNRRRHRRPNGDAATDERLAGMLPEIARWDLPGSHGRSYGAVSGDFNPVHLWAWSARPFGFRAPILHGACIAAMIARVIADQRWGGEAGALRRLRIRFRAPLLLPAEVVLRASETAASGQFELCSRRRGSERLCAAGDFAGG